MRPSPTSTTCRRTRCWAATSTCRRGRSTSRPSSSTGGTTCTSRPGPSIARMPLLAFTDSYDGKLSAPSMLIAWCTSTLLLTLLIWRVRRLLRPDAALTTRRGDRSRGAGGEHLGRLGRALPGVDAVRVPRGLLMGDRHVAGCRLLHARLPPAALHAHARQGSRVHPGRRALPHHRRVGLRGRPSAHRTVGPRPPSRAHPPPLGRAPRAGGAPPPLGGHRVQLGEVPAPVHVPARGPGVDECERAAPARPRRQRGRPRVTPHLPGHRHRLPPP